MRVSPSRAHARALGSLFWTHGCMCPGSKRRQNRTGRNAGLPPELRFSMSDCHCQAMPRMKEQVNVASGPP